MQGRFINGPEHLVRAQGGSQQLDANDTAPELLDKDAASINPPNCVFNCFGNSCGKQIRSRFFSILADFPALKGNFHWPPKRYVAPCSRTRLYRIVDFKTIPTWQHRGITFARIIPGRAHRIWTYEYFHRPTSGSIENTSNCGMKTEFRQ